MAKAHDYLTSRLDFAHVFYKAPAVMAALVRGNGNYFLSAMRGARKADLPDQAPGNQIKDTDAFQLASCSKPVSGYMLALFLKASQFNWKTTIGEVFPELTNPACRKLYNIRDDYLRASIRDMMSHTARFRYTPTKGTYSTLVGMIDGFDAEQVEEYSSRKAEMQRRFNYMLTSQQDVPGKVGVYNGGPILPVAMVERITGKSYQTLMQEYVFDPLEMTHANIGRPATPASPPDGVWPHSFDFNALKFIPAKIYVTRVREYETHMPAGGVNLSAGDAGRFITAQFVNSIGKQPLRGVWLEETFTHFANGCSVSGWLPGGAPAPSPGFFISHDGDFGLGHARFKIWPYKGEGYVVITNGSGEGPMDGVEKFNIGLTIANFVSDEIEKMLTDWSTMFPGE